LFESAADVPTIVDPKDAAESAGLRYVSDARPGIRRRKSERVSPTLAQTAPGSQSGMSSGASSRSRFHRPGRMCGSALTASKLAVAGSGSSDTLNFPTLGPAAAFTGTGSRFGTETGWTAGVAWNGWRSGSGWNSVGVVSVFNLESSGVQAPERRPRVVIYQRHSLKLARRPPDQRSHEWLRRQELQRKQTAVGNAANGRKRPTDR